MNRISRYTALTLCAVVLTAACGDKNTPKNYIRVDRMAIPAINTVFIADADKDDFNTAVPSNDIATYKTTVQNKITALRTAVNGVAGFPAEDSPGISAADLAGVLIPDVVTIDFSNAVAFPNGRQLTIDVVDAAVGLTLNRGNALGGGGGLGDAINANDKTFLTTFPYLAAPN